MRSVTRAADAAVAVCRPAARPDHPVQMDSLAVMASLESLDQTVHPDRPTNKLHTPSLA